MRTATVVRLGILGVAAIAAVLLFAFRDRLTGEAHALQVGDCIDLPAATEFSEVQHRPCGDAHDAEIFRIVAFPAQDTYPTEAEFEAFFGNACVDAGFQPYTGLVFEDAVEIEVEYYVPVERAWNAGDRDVVCYLFPAGGGKVDHSYRAG